VKGDTKSHGMNKNWRKRAGGIFLFFIVPSAFAETTNSALALPATGSFPDPTGSLLRILGAFALVIGIFFGGVWLFKNWQRLAVQRGRAPKLNVLETRSLGGRHAVYVVGYEQERFLIAASSNGVTLLSHLPAAAGNEPDAETKAAPAPSFSEALKQVLKGK
jgi:flagellar biogenesis protein FliO